MKLRHILIIAVFILFNVFVGWSLYLVGKKDKEEEKPKTIFVPTLTAAMVENKTEIMNVGGFGTITSFNAVDLACEVQGKLTAGKHNLKPGVKFKKGDLLFKINDTDAQYSLRARKSSFITIIANLLPDLRTDFPEEFDKWNNYINDIKLNENLPQLPSWKSSKEKIFISTRNVLTEYFNIKGLEEQLNKYNVYAPFSGVITDVYMNNYSVVNPGSRILRIVETDNFEVAVSIGAEQLDLVHVGAQTSIYSTEGILKGSGVVVRISEVINKNTQSVDVYVKPKSLDGYSFIEGEYIHVKIDQQDEQTGFRIPKEALTDDHVYVYSPSDSTLQPQVVQVVETNAEGVFVKGLKDNMIVVTQEVLNLTDTSKYQVLIK